jgi:hypothetical protein
LGQPQEGGRRLFSGIIRDIDYGDMDPGGLRRLAIRFRGRRRVFLGSPGNYRVRGVVTKGGTGGRRAALGILRR